ncbi:hypothetical protein [Paenibacillus sp. Marseille-Q4541]|uniref:hypothetical protein n=1 Tax=Paenibacillus sp. Marseille-Q4541 TaxID=2831522 RepID=UPI001BA44926|nr:hypothetical protein [Paenibacillus sp. Marseille-Q4541]
MNKTSKSEKEIKINPAQLQSLLQGIEQNDLLQLISWECVPLGENKQESSVFRVLCTINRYLGPNKTLWDTRFQNLDNRNVLVCFKPETVVVRDQSFITVI